MTTNERALFERNKTETMAGCVFSGLQNRVSLHMQCSTDLSDFGILDFSDSDVQKKRSKFSALVPDAPDVIFCDPSRTRCIVAQS